MEGWQNQFDDTKMAVAELQALATRLTPAMLARDTHARIERSMNLGRTIAGEIEKLSVAYFKNALVNDILGRADGLVRVAFSSRLALTHGIPKVNSLIRFGRKSTTCSFTSMTAARCCVAILATGPRSWGECRTDTIAA